MKRIFDALFAFKNIKYNTLEIREDVIEMVSGEEVDISNKITML